MADSKSLYSSILEDGRDVPTVNYNDVGEGGYGQLVYPKDLFDSNGSYANCYTAFFISFKEDKKLESLKSSDSSTTVLKDYKSKGSGLVSSVQTATDGNKLIEKQTSNALLTGATGAFIGSFIGNSVKLDGTTGVVVKASGTIAATTIATKLMGDMTDSFNISTDRKTQKACICLPTPAIVANYSINWSEETNKLMGGIVAGGSSFFQTIKNLDMGDLSTPTKIKEAFGNIAGSLGKAAVSMALATPMFGTTLGVMSRIAPNPRKEQLFKDVGMREFAISYIFAPRSEAEAKNVESIITQFKYHAHPSFKDDAGFLLNYPSEFDIIHYHNGKRNTHLPKHTTSVLTKVSVDYSNGNDNYTFFENGMPTIIKMDLTFVEIAMLTKEDIIKGY
jgi:hypothetical protein